MASFGEKIKEFSNKPSGKAAMIAVPVVVLVLIVAVIAVSFLKIGVGTQDAQPIAAQNKESTPPAETTSETESAATETPAATATPPIEATATLFINENFEVYETRDPFKVVDPNDTETASPTSNASTGDQSTSTVEKHFLSVLEIKEENDILFANVKYDSTKYLVGAGDRVGDSSFQVNNITADQVTFLYGDDLLTLGPGEEVSKYGIGFRGQS